MKGTSVSALIAPCFYDVHAAIRAGEYAEIWLKGGRGSAKSSFAAIEVILKLMRDKNANAIVYRRVAATLRDSVYDQLIKALDWLGVSAYWETRLSPLEIRCPRTGQRILFRGADDPAKSKSITLRSGYFGVLWFEELAEFRSADAVRTIKASIIRGGENTLTICSYNPPQSAGSWVNKDALLPKPRRLVHHSTYLQIPRKWLGEDFFAEADALKQTNELAYRHMYLGEVTGSGGNVFDNLQLRPLTDAEKQADKVYSGLDFGFAIDPDAYVRWGWDAKARKIIALSEYYGAKNSTERLATEVKRRAAREVVRCDSADPRMISELTQRGVNAIGVKKGAGSVEHGMRWLQDLGAIVIDPAITPNIAREFTGYEYEADGRGGWVSDYPDKDNHSIDATRYALEPVLTQRKVQTVDKSLFGF